MNGLKILLGLMLSQFMALSPGYADVRHYQVNPFHYMTYVENNDAWQPEDVDRALIVRAMRVEKAPRIDGAGSDFAWSRAEKLTVPLSYGSVREAEVAAVYTDRELFLLVSWADPTRDDQHKPWIWSEFEQRYLEGRQIEDSLLVSFEAGCEWTPSLLSGYVYDFDGWRWLAARSDPVGQAVDIMGHVQNRWIRDSGYVKYSSRNKTPFWNLKFTDQRRRILTKSWSELDRAYKLAQINREVYVSLQPDGARAIDAVRRLAPPSRLPPIQKVSKQRGKAAQAGVATPVPVAPRFEPVRLEGNAGEVSAKGRWVAGRWTVEFRRALVTPAGILTDALFERLTQFSIHVFNRTERVDESSESGRLFLQFLPAAPGEGQ